MCTSWQLHVESRLVCHHDYVILSTPNPVSPNLGPLNGYPTVQHPLSLPLPFVDVVAAADGVASALGDGRRNQLGDLGRQMV